MKASISTRPASFRTAQAARAPLRQAGGSLLEVAMAFSVFAVVIGSVSSALVRSVRYGNDCFMTYRALVALRDVAAELQDAVHRSAGAAGGRDLLAVYEEYHGKTISVPDLPSGKVSVSCFVDETVVPLELGGPQDLNGDGDAGDAFRSGSAGPKLELLPVELKVVFQAGGQVQTRRTQRLYTWTVDG